MRGLLTAAKWGWCFHITILFSIWAGCCSATDENGGRSFEMRMIYKYSDEFRQHMKGRPGMQDIVSNWPRHSTPAFYHELALHDRRRLASRNLLTADVSLFPSNTTLLSRNMGGLHYSFLTLGTPPKAFFVALDTGSDLLWVPCDCQQCSTADWATYGITIPDFEFAIYSPSNSTTSKAVPCTDVVCTSTLDPNVCNANAPQSCSYAARYLSSNTSSSGTIVQDVVYLTSETTGSKLTSEIYLGCGKLQTGDFLEGGAPNGLFGLGPDIYSVPSTFARNGVANNVLSMCFSREDGSGRLVFGRKAGGSMQSTPIIPIRPSIYYVLGIEGFVAAGVRLNITQRVVFDTGTSLTILPSDIIKSLGDALSSASSLEPFEVHVQSLTLNYCWNFTTSAKLDILSSLSMVFSGGGLWKISGPLLRVNDDSGNLLFVCLGILSANSSSAVSIIGFNFMRDYEFFLDQETLTFSWNPSDCSGTNATSTLAPSMTPELAPVSAPVPAKAAPAPKSSQSQPLAPDNLHAPPPSPISLFNEASSISFRPILLVLSISSTFFLVLSR